MNHFEFAARNKLRWGNLSVEDLFDLPLTSKTGKPNLDDVARDAYNELQGAENPPSFVEKASATSDKKNLLTVKFEIVKSVIDTRVAENEAKANEADRAAKKQKLLAALERRENDALEQLSPEEIRAQIAAL